MSRVTPVDQTVIVIVSSLSSEVSGMPGRRGIGFEEQLVAGYYSKGVSSTVVDLWCLQKNPSQDRGFYIQLPKTTQILPQHSLKTMIFDELP